MSINTLIFLEKTIANSSYNMLANTNILADYCCRSYRSLISLRINRAIAKLKDSIDKPLRSSRKHFVIYNYNLKTNYQDNY